MNSKKIKTIQYFSDEYLEQCRKLSPAEILEFLDSFQKLHAQNMENPSILISLKVPEDLLGAFKLKAKLNGVKYQTQIKKLMEEWVKF